MDTPLLAAVSFEALAPATDTVQTFRQILTDFSEGLLCIPEHQRDGDAWDRNKQVKYVRRLLDAREGRHPPGSFATYQLTGNGRSRTWLNDGLQRLTTLRQLQAEPALFDLDWESVVGLLQQNISVQHRHYASHEHAMEDFQLINNGTRLTPYELCSGVLKYMENYDSQWQGLFDGVEAAVKESEIRLGARPKKQGLRAREQEHARRRHTLALFHRFLTEERDPKPYPDVGAKDVQTYVDKRDVVEWRLREALKGKSHSDAKRLLGLFQTFMAAETATIDGSLRTVLPPNTALAPVTHRWLLDLAVWRRNNQVPRAAHALFLERLLKETRGSAQWIRESEDGERKIVTLSLSHLGYLPLLAEWAEMPDFCKRQRRRKPSGYALPGFDRSHYEPFSLNGDGPTFLEPAPLNRSRGAHPVENTEPSTTS